MAQWHTINQWHTTIHLQLLLFAERAYTWKWYVTWELC